MARTAPLSDEQARTILEKVRRDSGLPASVRTRAWSLAGETDNPALAVSRLQQFAQRVLPGLPREVPTVDLSRVMSVGTFLLHMTRPEFRDAFLTPDDFIAFAESSPLANELAQAALADSPALVPWERSWLAPTRRLRGLNGLELKQALELGEDASPPFVVINLPLDRMLDAGVTVRTPGSLDSVLGPSPQWSPSGLASGIDEFVDGDIPRAAIGTIEWRR